jgi:Helix-turn-helix domain
MPRKKRSPEQGNSEQPAQSGSILDRDGLISTEELAAFLGKPIATLDTWASRGGGPTFTKVGRDRKYLPADVSAYLAKGRHEDRQEPAA